jgi:hypothetical protein
MQDIHGYMSETNYDARKYHVAANLWLKFMADIHVILFPVTQSLTFILVFSESLILLLLLLSS